MVETKSSILDILSLRYLLDLHIEREVTEKADSWRSVKTEREVWARDKPQ